MSEERPSEGSSSRSWFERLSHVLSGEPQDRQDLIDLLRAAEQRNILHGDALPMIEGALQVSDMQVRDIMVPRVQMVVVNHDAKPKDFLPTVIESGHSRFPVIGDDVDEVVGILLAKDLLAYMAKREDRAFNIRDVMRPTFFVPESKRLNVLLREFRSSRNHMAIVVNEYSGVSGLVTIEDIIEEIVGEIEDEHDIDEEDFIKQHGKNRYTVKALTPIEDFNKYFHTNFSDDEYDTVGGLMLSAFGHLPKRGETLDYGGFNVQVLRADKRRIQLLRLTKLETENVLGEAS
ncbi:MAG: CBS domain-containing protein [Gammaproteobacteria bacterium]|nr:CBS domain-containing protein [Gammaproteobacteria bacterium]MCI0591551.1 CBS domain-containing protein [Gammaproteobacteria bacterium]